METDGTLLLHHSDIAQLLSLDECITAVEKIFRLQGEGKVPHPRFWEYMHHAAACT